MRSVLGAAAVVLGLGIALVVAPLLKRADHSGKMTELHVRDVVPLVSIHQAAIILSPDKGDLIVPVLVSQGEGAQVAAQLAGHKSHGGLLRQAIAELGGKLVRVELTDLKGDHVLARVVVKRAGREMTLRGSAAASIGLAIEDHVPVMASQQVIAGLGLTQEQIHALVNGHSGHHPGGETGEHALKQGGSISL